MGPAPSADPTTPPGQHHHSAVPSRPPQLPLEHPQRPTMLQGLLRCLTLVHALLGLAEAPCSHTDSPCQPQHSLASVQLHTAPLLRTLVAAAE